ncbi:diaminopimelate decarboxylase [Xanthomonas campestris]|nr:diaminopimelate decarboxylase [Xanthomonas sp. CFBP 8151]
MPTFRFHVLTIAIAAASLTLPPSAIAAQAGRCVPVFLRMNIAVPGAQSTRLMMGGQPSPVGLDPDDLDAAIQRLRASPSLRLEGFHFHLMSHQRDAGAQLHLIAAYLRIVQQWRQAYALGPLRVNAGGGFGVDYLAPEGRSTGPASAPACLPCWAHTARRCACGWNRGALSAPAAAGI